MELLRLFMMAAALGTAVPALANPEPPATVKPTVRFNEVAQRCGNGVHPNTLQAIARVESGFNPYAIGVVRGSLKRQPRNLAEAVSTAKMLHAQGRNFSMGLMQVNKHNLAAYGLNYETVFDVCNNISAGAKILKSCFDRAGGTGQQALQKAFSCYYSGNFRFGFKRDFKGQPPYVTKIIMSALSNSPHQTIGRFSGSLTVSSKRSEPARLVKTGYVPPPSTPQTGQTETPPPRENPDYPDKTAATAKTVHQPKQEWNLLADENVQGKRSWDIFQEF